MCSEINQLPEVNFLTSGQVTDPDKRAAEQALHAALAATPVSITAATITLTVIGDTTLPSPALAQAVIDTPSTKLRAQAAAPTLPKAIALLQTRLALRASTLAEAV